uniref:Uncharacterized protein n=1 Tax=Physcomitrium patens TaxID=3218 RepID=A0A2K1IKB6_PHYPA|nr:hypothetical protein PHYPA_028416 [Physcomitrium patens]
MGLDSLGIKRVQAGAEGAVPERSEQGQSHFPQRGGFAALDDEETVACIEEEPLPTNSEILIIGVLGSDRDRVPTSRSRQRGAVQENKRCRGRGCVHPEKCAVLKDSHVNYVHEFVYSHLTRNKSLHVLNESSRRNAIVSFVQSSPSIHKVNIFIGVEKQLIRAEHLERIQKHISPGNPQREQMAVTGLGREEEVSARAAGVSTSKSLTARSVMR